MGLVVGLVAVSGMLAGQAGAAYAAVGVPKPSTAHAAAEPGAAGKAAAGRANVADANGPSGPSAPIPRTAQ